MREIFECFEAWKEESSCHVNIPSPLLRLTFISARSSFADDF